MAGLFSSLFLLAAAGAGGATSDANPLHLVVEPVGNGISLTVVGESDVAMTARYSLEVSASGGGNRSVQRGVARLRPGLTETLATVRLGHVEQGWSAVLKVSPEGGQAYERTVGAAGR